MLIRKKFANFFYKIANKLDNNNNIDFSTNGEGFFLKRFAQYKNNGNTCVIFDVGANQGDWAKIANDLVANSEIHLFEPSTAAFKVIVSEYERHSNLFINNTACSNKNELRTLFSDNEGSTLASFTQRDLKAYDIDMNKKEKVKCIKLSDYITQKKILHIDLLKIDVEGHELDVLLGLGEYLNMNFIDCIQFEYGGTNIDSKVFLKELFELFKKSGFRVGKLYPKKLYITNYRHEFEKFQYSNWVAISETVDFQC